jgi:hypothetical protein
MIRLCKEAYRLPLLYAAGNNTDSHLKPMRESSIMVFVVLDGEVAVPCTRNPL